MDQNNQAAANAGPEANQALPAVPAAPPAAPPAPPAVPPPPPLRVVPIRAVRPPPPPPKRQRTNTFRNAGPTPADANAMLEAIERLNLYSVPRQDVNSFVPDASHLFHVLGTCDQLMNTCDQFTSTVPHWIPIVSHLYISVLWLYQILHVHHSSGYGPQYSTILEFMNTRLRIQECPIPGPLVPFFQSLASVNGPFEWTGDITPIVPDLADIWDEDHFPTSQFARLLPFPVIILDQLYHFATWPVPANQNLYDNFLWYNNIFGLDSDEYYDLLYMGPQMTASLHTTEIQLESARTFWNRAFNRGITRFNHEGDVLTDLLQIFGFRSQAGRYQIQWFQHVTSAMQIYCRHFSHTALLSSISPIGLGASAVYGFPTPPDSARNWLYPPADQLTPFATSRLEAARPIPEELGFRFVHADQNLEPQAEQYGMLSHINMIWGNLPLTQHDWDQIDYNATRSGDYWQVPFLRASSTVDLADQMAATIVEEFYLPDANY